MGKQYYYFVATLPSLEMGGKPPFSLDEFLDQCARLLEEEDNNIMRSLLSPSDETINCNSTFYNDWIQFWVM